MSEYLEEFVNLFREVKSRNYIASHRHGNTGIGKTFEDCCRITENNLDMADYKDIEIKSQRAYTGSYITLFTKSPTHPDGVNQILKDNYGTPDNTFPNIKVLHTSCFSNRFNTHSSGFGFKLTISDQDEKIYLLVKSLKTNRIIRDDIYWDYAILKNIIQNKLKYIAFITAKTKVIEQVEYFYFNKMILLSEFNFLKFIDLIKNGLIMFDIRIGAYKSGRNIGKQHDHGSGFRISKRNINQGFKVDIIE